MGYKEEDMQWTVFGEKQEGQRTNGSQPHTVEGTHIPTGITATSGARRTQHENMLLVKCMIRFGLQVMEYTGNER